MIDPEIVEIFLEEAADIVSSWEKECLKLEKEIDNPKFDGIFRCAHNIKGSAKSVGLDEFGNFVHKIEDVINLLKSGEVVLVPKLVEFLLTAHSVMVGWIEGLRKDIEYKPQTDNVLKTIDDIKAYVAKQSEGFTVNWKNFGTVAVESGEVTEEQVARAVSLQQRKLGEIMVDEGMIAKEAISKILDVQEKNNEKAQSSKKSTETIRIAASKIDKLIQLIGELSIHQSIISHSKSTGTLDSYICGNAINLAEKINSEIQTQALSLRMVPLENLFQRVERIIRDIARSQGKKVKVHIKGSDVELDKTVIEQITDPLIHIVRNAVDHGIETVEERAQTTKSEFANITILGIQDATGIGIIVKDDGRGLHRKKIVDKAIKMGIISAEDHLSQNEVYQLIFHPGFSTAAQITDVSGRGVGMDVVKQAVNQVGGHLVIESEEGNGSTFTVNLPTTLSIIDGLIVEVSGNKYIVPLMDLAEIIDLNEFKMENTGSGDMMLNLRGKIVPVESLENYFPKSKKRVVFKKKRGTRAEKEQAVIHEEKKIVTAGEIGRPALILELGMDKIAFAIDSIIAQQQIVVRPLNEQLAHLAGYNGGTIMADGDAGMIIALKDIARRYIEECHK